MTVLYFHCYFFFFNFWVKCYFFISYLMGVFESECFQKSCFLFYNEKLYEKIIFTQILFTQKNYNTFR